MNQQPPMEIYNDADNGGCFIFGNEFINITFGYDFPMVSQLGCSMNISDFEEIQMDSVPMPSEKIKRILQDQSDGAEEMYKMTRIEVWGIDLDQKQSVGSAAMNQTFKNQVFDRVSNIEGKLYKAHPWRAHLMTVSSFRSSPVFMVPSHIKIKEMA